NPRLSTVASMVGSKKQQRRRDEAENRHEPLVRARLRTQARVCAPRPADGVRTVGGPSHTAAVGSPTGTPSVTWMRGKAAEGTESGPIHLTVHERTRFHCSSHLADIGRSKCSSIR